MPLRALREANFGSDAAAPSTIIRAGRANIAGAGQAAIDTAEALYQARHKTLFAIIDNARLNGEFTVKSLREVTSSPSLSGALTIGRDAARSALSRQLDQTAEVSKIALNGLKTSVVPARDYLKSLSRGIG